jgi:hypothetical protein
MTRDQLSDVPLTSSAEFEAVLAELIERATSAGVDVRGPWMLETAGVPTNWEVEFYELATEPEDED